MTSNACTSSSFCGRDAISLCWHHLARTFNSDGLHPGRLGHIMMRVPKPPRDLAKPPLVLCSCPVRRLESGSLQPLDCSVQLCPSLLSRPCPVSAFVVARLHGIETPSAGWIQLGAHTVTRRLLAPNSQCHMKGHPSLHAAVQEQASEGMQKPKWLTCSQPAS